MLIIQNWTLDPIELSFGPVHALDQYSDKKIDDLYLRKCGVYSLGTNCPNGDDEPCKIKMIV